MMPMRTADKIMGIVLILLGVAMIWGGYVMDRLEIRGIHPASIPGLVPMGLGALIAICGGLLFASGKNETQDEPIDFGDMSKLLWTAGLSVVFAVVLIGRVPFAWATFLFIAAMTTRFTWTKGAGIVANRRALFFGLASGVFFSATISVLFRYAFLVRLP